jgi:hypothetical protein
MRSNVRARMLHLFKRAVWGGYRLSDFAAFRFDFVLCRLFRHVFLATLNEYADLLPSSSSAPLATLLWYEYSPVGVEPKRQAQ